MVMQPTYSRLKKVIIEHGASLIEKQHVKFKSCKESKDHYIRL